MPADPQRRELLMSLGNLTSGLGLEIGPLDKPVALRPTCDVRYVDVYDSPAIRSHYRAHPGVNVDDVPDIDFALHSPSGEIRSLVNAVKSDAPYQWVVASHVIEHVPDAIGWLSDVASILADDGALVLAIPDRRFTFDALRPPTTVGQMLQAHNDRDTRPSIRAVYDYFRTVVEAPVNEMWEGKQVTTADRLHDLTGTMNQVRLSSEEKRYVDCHVWLFTPASFVEQLTELGLMGLLDFTIQQIVPTAYNELEFYVSLKRVPRGTPSKIISELRTGGVTSWVDEDPAAISARLASTSPLDTTSEPEVPPLTVHDRAPVPNPAFPVSRREEQLIRVKRRFINAVLRRPPQ